MASPLGPPPHSENTEVLPSGVTREQRPLRISVRITAPSGMTTGPSGKPKPLARIFMSVMSALLRQTPHLRIRLLSPARGRGWVRGKRTSSPPHLASPPSGGEEHEVRFVLECHAAAFSALAGFQD